MKKIEKVLVLPVVCHAALFLAIVIMELCKNSLGGIVALFELCGVIVTPMLYAVVMIANAILYDGKVSEYFLRCVIYLAGIGAVRILVYALLAPSTILLPVGAFFVSVAIFCLWEALFAFTDKMMRKKRIGRKNKR